MQTKSRYHEEDSQDTNSHKTPGRQNKVKATNSQNRIKIIAKIEGTQSSAQQNVIKTNQQEQDKLLRTGSSLSYLCVWEGGLNAFYWYQIFTLDYIVVKTQTNVYLA